MVEKAKSRGNADAYRGSSTHYTAKILVLGEFSLCERSVRLPLFLIVLRGNTADRVQPGAAIRAFYAYWLR